ncbi:Rid family detoxifying hydrolase [Pseudomonadales bacterium]|jgi:reactive intermediate/imine deaminase|nr:RidA family protein [Gammaproteobacteria bacterium]MDA7771599.1 Rid family detoxifying hydrolase [Pseudomonadales bacterium]MDC1017884.1 Rid family detoxifying hydrolase [Pseudomonadales bacterium]MDC1478505.1 Rid family detoxifying hydrolase [Pseudomonadales bacterium]|tara:strand:+ start:10099 stop:10482 length:384 start_codon:yes stop_codon:yes gene_type:complete
MTKKFITTTEAPAAIGVYSQAVESGNTLYISGQIPLIPDSMEIVSENIEEQIEQVFDNLTAICVEAGAKLDDTIKFNVYLTDLAHFPKVNTAMEQRLAAPYPARAVVEVSALPKGVQVEVDAIVDLS